MRQNSPHSRKQMHWRGKAIVAAALVALSSSVAADAADQRLRVGSTAFPASLDPAVGTSGYDHQFLYLVYDRLIDADPTTGALVPGLATEWEWVGDGQRTLRLTIRPDVLFHDGTALDAAAVVASLTHYQTAGVQSELRDVVLIEAVAPNIVEITLNHIDVTLPIVLSDRPGMIISPTALQTYGDAYPIHPSGTGPYRVTNIVSGAEITFDAFADYWGGTPNLDGIDWQTFAQSTALQNAARSGQLDIAVQIPEADISSLRGNENFDVSIGPSFALSSISLNAALAPFDSADFRRAVNMAINRDDILQAQNNGEGEVATQPYGTQSVYYSEHAAAAAAYNPDAARALVEGAGLTGTSFTCNFFPGYGSEVSGPLIAENLRDIGITMELRQQTLAQAISDFREGLYPCIITGWTGRLDPSITFSLIYASTGSSNFGHIDLGVDQMITALQGTFDRDARIALVQEIVATVADAGPPQIGLLRRQSVDLIGTNVEGYQANVSGKPDLRSVSLR